MNDFIKIPKRLAVAALVIMTALVLLIIILYFSAPSAVVQNFLADQVSGSVTASTAALKAVLLPLIVMMLFPWALNLIGILYLKRYPVASAVMFIFAGLMLLFTLIFPVLLVTAGTMLIIRHRHYIQHEKYKTHYE